MFKTSFPESSYLLNAGLMENRSVQGLRLLLLVLLVLQVLLALVVGVALMLGVSIIFASAQQQLAVAATAIGLTSLAYWLLRQGLDANRQVVQRALREQHDNLKRREEAEDALRLSEERFSRIFRSSPSAIVVQAFEGMQGLACGAHAPHLPRLVLYEMCLGPISSRHHQLSIQ